MTFFKQAQNCTLSVSLRDFNINNLDVYSLDNYNQYKCLVDLITFTPTNQSHLGKKFKHYRINGKNKNEVVKEIADCLGVEKVFVFSSYESGMPKTDLKDDVLAFDGTMLLYNCTNGILESLYAGIRNALAHGNVICKNSYYIIYAVSNSTKEYDANISFLLRIDKLQRINAFRNVLEKYA